MTRALTYNEYRQKLLDANPDIEPVGAYLGMNNKTAVKGRSCGHEWEAKPANLIYNRSGCPICYGHINKTDNQFKEELKKISPTLVVVGKYVNDSTPIETKCYICNHLWSPKPNHLLQGHGCPKCNHTSTSFMEQYLLSSISWALREDRVESRNKKAIGMELDIYVPDYPTPFAIEIGNWRFHSSRFEKDIEKRSRCNKKGIRLFVIYDQYDSERLPFSKDCFTYSICLGQEEGHSALFSLANILHAELGLAPFSATEHRMFENEARLNSQRVTTEEFVQEMRTINPNIEIKGEYVRANRGIECLCTQCGNTWFAKPSSLRRGSGCKKCADRISGEKQRISPDSFEKRLHELNPNIELLSPYARMEDEIEMRCTVHNIIFTKKAKDAMRHATCPKCGNESKGQWRKKTDEQFRIELASKNPGITPLEPYRGDAEKILVRCETCKNEWMPQAGTLLQSRGCPKCKAIKTGERCRKSPEQYETELLERNAKYAAGLFELLDAYTKATTPITCHCLQCGRIWKANPSCLLNGSGCKHCSTKRTV